MSLTANLGLTKPDRGSTGWDTDLNTNFDLIDTGYGNNIASIADLPEFYIQTGNFSTAAGGSTQTLPKAASTNEYSVSITPAARSSSIGDIWVEKSTASYAVKHSGDSNDAYSAQVTYIGDVASYGGSIYRRWYVSTDAAITDHSDDTDEGSLAWVISEIGASPAIVELPANKTYVLTANDVDATASSNNIYFHFQPGAIIQPAAGIQFTVYDPARIIAQPTQQIIDTTNNSTDPLVFTEGGEVYAAWWYDQGTYYAEAIQLAIDSLEGDISGIVTMPVGSLQLDAKLTIQGSGIMLRGTGGVGNSHDASTLTQWGTLLVNKTGTDDAIEIGLADTYISDIVLRDFALDGDSGTATAGNGIVLDSQNYPAGVSNLKMYNVSISHVEDYGLYINGNVFECAFYGVEFRYNDYGIYAAATYGNTGEIFFYGCEIWQSTTYGFYKGTGVADYHFFGGSFGLNGSGIYASNGFSFHGVRFEQNTTYGLYCHGNGVQVYGCLFDNSTTAIYIPNADGTIINGAYFTSNTTDISIGSAPDGTTLIGLYSADGEVTISNSSRSTQFHDANYEIITAAGAARVYGISELNSAGGAMAVTLANGSAIGQQKRFYHITDGGDVTLTVALLDGSSAVALTSTAAGSYLALEWTYASPNGWITIANNGFAT